MGVTSSRRRKNTKEAWLLKSLALRGLFYFEIRKRVHSASPRRLQVPSSELHSKNHPSQNVEKRRFAASLLRVQMRVDLGGEWVICWSESRVCFGPRVFRVGE